MSIAYQLAYRLGVAPWEHKGEGSLRQLADLIGREEEGRTAPFGRAVDLGCGRGEQAVELARRGWEVTGVDAVIPALKAARHRAVAAGVHVNFCHGDVTRLEEVLAPGYRLAVDLGCWHGLPDAQRRAYADQLRAVTEPGAALVLFAFGPGRRGPLPRGVDRAGLEAAFAGWRVTDEVPVDVTGVRGLVAKAEPRWFRLTHD